MTQPMTKFPTPTERQKGKATTQRRHQTFRLHNDCGPTSDG